MKPGLPLLGVAVAVTLGLTVGVAVGEPFSAGQIPHQRHQAPLKKSFEFGVADGVAVAVVLAETVGSGADKQADGGTGSAAQYAAIAEALPAALVNSANALGSSVLPALVTSAYSWQTRYTISAWTAGSTLGLGVIDGSGVGVTDVDVDVDVETVTVGVTDGDQLPLGVG